MTKEEYKKLLQSDYWKGYSYSLIKERNFTCEDCGRQFYNERNKLQVHHLVYRDVNPWSYNPDEVVVLCEECHKKRHGLAFEPEQQTSSTQTLFGEYDKGQTNSTDKINERFFASRYSERFESSPSDYLIEPEPRSGYKLKYVVCRSCGEPLTLIDIEVHPLPASVLVCGNALVYRSPIALGREI